MPIQHMDNVLIVVEDLESTIVFFCDVGLELVNVSNGPLEGAWMDQVMGIDGARLEIAVLRTADGRSGVELAQFHTPAAVQPEPSNAPANTLGIRRVVFATDELDATVARLQGIGAELVGDIVEFEESFRICYIRGPENIVVGLAEQAG